MRTRPGEKTAAGFCAALAWMIVLMGPGALFAAESPGSTATGRMKKAEDGLVVPIEVLPGEADKVVDTTLPEKVSVAVLGGPDMDARDVDPGSISLSGAAVTKGDDGSLASYLDVNHDRRTDLVVQVTSTRIRMGEGTRRVFLSGRTLDGRPLHGSAALRTVEGVRWEHWRAARPNPSAEKLPPLPVDIDILPGDPSNRIEMGNRGTVAVAVLSRPEFDATTLDPASLSLAGSPATRRKGGGMRSFEDVNGDDRADLVVEFPRRFLQLQYGETQAVLRGVTPGGRFLQGIDRVQIGEKATMTFDSDTPKVGEPQPSPEFVQTAGITINDLSQASPYPSSITVSGLPGVVSKVRVTLKGLTHSFPNDLDILLVGPTGQSLVLMSDVGGPGPGVSNINITFDDNSVYRLNTTDTPGTFTYPPANFGGGDLFPAPAPAPSAATALSVFNGTNPNGVWSLYVVDDLGGDSGSIADGWSLDFITATEICNTTAVTIFDNVAAAPYPSPINVSGLPAAVSKVAVKLKGLSHTYPDDIDMLLVGPGGQAALVMSDVGGTGPGISNQTLVLDDNAALALDASANPLSGTYQPVDRTPGDAFPGLAPPGPYQSSLYPFDGTNPNGFWLLYVLDDSAADSGGISGGWCLDITAMTPVVHSNTTFMAIPNGEPAITQGQASLYPSTLIVSGVHGAIANTTVTLNGLSHTYPQDLDIMLVGPLLGSTSPHTLLMSDVGGMGPGVSGVTLTFDSAAASIVPVSANPSSGTYQPTNDDSAGTDTLPSPAPNGTNGYLSDFNLIDDPNGPWSLYVYDDAAGDVGTLAGGWTLTLQTFLAPSTARYPFSYCDFAHPLTIPLGAPGTTQGAAVPYPSDLLVTGFPGQLDHYKVVVDLYGLTHSFPSDLDIALVGPDGKSVLLMSDAGGIGPGVNNIDLTFDDDAAALVAQSTNPASGRYRPTDYDDGFADAFPPNCPPSCVFSPPTGPFGKTLSAFKGSQDAAFWQLFVYDDGTGDTGSLAGWCLRFLPSPAADEVPNLRWTGDSDLAWDAAFNATSYDLYRGDPSQLPSLLDGTPDSCARATTLVQTLSGLTETPAPGAWYWYLVRGRNAEGEGPPGFARTGPQVPARFQEGTGVCP